MRNTTKVYYDLEFIEGQQTERFLGIELRKWNYIAAYFFCIVAFALVTLVIKKYLYEPEIPLWLVVGSTLSGIFTTLFAWNSDPKRWVNKPTIDLISIGMVSEDNREYYAISKDFNLREAWDRYQMKQVHGDARNTYPEGVREYWIRENVLKPIWIELEQKDSISPYMTEWCKSGSRDEWFTYKRMKRLINKYGKTNEQIAKEVEKFCTDIHEKHVYGKTDCELYGYYSAYDHVRLCWLFGVMNDLPDGMPWYTIDLQQDFDRAESHYKILRETDYQLKVLSKLGKTITSIKELPNYPKQTNEHNALADAHFNKELHKFLQSL